MAKNFSYIEDADRIKTGPPTDFNDQMDSLLRVPSYLMAYEDAEYLTSAAARPIRMQSELMKPDWYMNRYGVRSTIIVFGSARFIDRDTATRRMDEVRQKMEAAPDDPLLLQELKTATMLMETSEYYEFAREFSYLVSRENRANQKPDCDGVLDYVICTGGGPGIMEAANRGAYEAGALSVGLNIQLPYEQRPNPYISPQLCFNFHYFAIRKLHFLIRAKALMVSPGGFGTLDELFETLTLRQTNRMQKIPILVHGEEFWSKLVNFEYMVESGVICPQDLDLFQYVETPHEAWEAIQEFHR